MTYADIDSAQFNITDGAFAPAFTGSATGAHDGGEIWSSILWEVRAKLIQRLGAEAGNKKVLQLVMDGMKVSPSNPTMMRPRPAENPLSPRVDGDGDTPQNAVTSALAAAGARASPRAIKAISVLRFM